MHILTAGIFKAACHGVQLPSTPGLARISQAFFFSPSPDVKIEPPMPYEMPFVQEVDRGLVSEEVGFKKNWREGMDYAEWNETMKLAYDKIIKFTK